MLDYAPAKTIASSGQIFAAVWPGERMPENGELLRLIAASKERLVAFQPERLSGYCAT